MASRIAGITVEIGGNVTGLSKALESVNKTIKTTQTQLKDVERLLKLDPTNTVLLTQKQEALKTAIASTKEKLEALKTAQEQAKAQMENGDLGKDKYDALQREIIATEQELERLAKEAANANTALNKLDSVGQTLEKVGDKMAGVGKNLTTYVTTPLAAVGTAAVKTAADFDEQMSKVSAISGATGKDFDALRDKAREMGSKTKFSATEAGQAFEYMAMAGWKTGDMLDGIEGIMNLAAASGEDLATTSDIVTDALTAFGLSAKDSGHFADILAAASSNANTNVSMMGETFKYAAPIAGALGYTAEDTALAIGLMANAGIKSSQAGTSLRSIMTNLTGDIKIAGAAIGEVTVKTTNADGSMRSFNDIIMDCRSAFANLTESEKANTAEALVGKNAMSGFLAIMNASEEDVNKLAGAIDHCDGAAEQMAATMQDNLNGQITILKSALQELAIQIGDALMPTIRNIVSKVQEFVEKLQGMDEETRNNIIQLAAFAAAIGPVLVVVGKLTAGVGEAFQSISSMGKGILTLINQTKLGVGPIANLGEAIGGISAPVAAVVAAIAVLAAAFVSLWKNNEEFRDNITAIWEGIKAKFEAFGQAITDRLNALGFDFENITEVLKAVWDGFCAVLAPVFEAAFNIISATLGTVLDVLVGLFDVFAGLFTGNWDMAWNGVKEIFSGIWEGIKGILSSVLDGLKGIADTFLGWFGTDWETVWTSIKTFFSETWNGIKDFFANIWNSITTTVTTVLSTISSAITSAWTAVKTTFTTIWDSIAGVVSSVWETIKNVVQVGILFIEELFSAAFQILTVPFRFIWENCQEILTAAWEAIKSIVSTAIDAVKTTLETTWNAIWSVLSPIIETIKTGITTAWEAIKIGVSTAVDAVKTTLETTWNAIWSALSPIIETIKTGITTAWESIKSAVLTAIDAIKTTLETTWNAIWSVLSPIIETIKNGITTAWEIIQTSVSTAIDAIKTTLENTWNAIWSALSPIIETIKTGITDAWETIKTSVTTAVDVIKTTLENTWNAIWSALSPIIETIKTGITTAWETIKTSVTTAVDVIKTTLENTWNAIWSVLSPIIETIKTGITTAWETIQTGVTNAVTTLQMTLSNVWNAIKSTISTTVDNIKTSITTAWDTAKSSVSSTMNSMKSTISSVWTSIKTTVSTAVDAAKNAIRNGFNAAKSTVSNIFGNIKSSISNAMSNAKTAVSNTISTIKSKLNFSWSLPHLKLPHVTITGKFSLDPPSVPHFSISWYKKAMEDGMILNAPTIFGMKGNQLLAGGEAGSETVVGTQSLMEMIRNAVASMAGGTTINYGGVNINVYAKENQDIRALADEIEYRINNNVMRRKAAVGT